MCGPTSGADSQGVPLEIIPPLYAAGLPCHGDDSALWFSESPAALEVAKDRCLDCPVMRECLSGALARTEPWGVWGGEIVERGQVVTHKRGRGRPRRQAA